MIEKEKDNLLSSVFDDLLGKTPEANFDALTETKKAKLIAKEAGKLAMHKRPDIRPFIRVDTDDINYYVIIESAGLNLNIEYEIRDDGYGLILWIFEGSDTNEDTDEILSFKIRSLREEIDIDDVEFIEEGDIIKIIVPRG